MSNRNGRRVSRSLLPIASSRPDDTFNEIADRYYREPMDSIDNSSYPQREDYSRPDRKRSNGGRSHTHIPTHPQLHSGVRLDVKRDRRQDRSRSLTPLEIVPPKPIVTTSAQLAPDPEVSIQDQQLYNLDSDTLSRALEDAATVHDTTEDGGLLQPGDEKSDDRIQVRQSIDAASLIEVQWDGRDDVEDCRQMSSNRKWIITILLAFFVFQIALASSVWGQTSGRIGLKFKVQWSVADLGLTLYMIGHAIGPLFSPISEYFGRKPVTFVALLVYIGLQLPTVFGSNIESMLIGRFFTGWAGGIVTAISFAIIGDLFIQDAIGAPMVLVSVAMQIGPVLAPVIASFVTELLSYQWVFRIMLIWSGVMAMLTLAIVPETYGPVLLAKKAKRMRQRTQNDNFLAPMEFEGRAPFKGFFKGLVRAFQVSFGDWIIAYTCIYAGLLYGILYSFFTGFPVVFQDVYQWKRQMYGISFLGIAAGMLVGAMTQPLWSWIYRRMVVSNNGEDEAEYWFPQLIAGGILVPAGLAMFGWTSWRSIAPIVPIVGTAVFGMGTILCLTSIRVFIIDGYRKHAVSGIAGHLLFTGLFAAFFPLFAGELMYRNIGPHWAPTVFAIITALCVVLHILSFEHGTKLRDRSRFSGNNTYR